jgi:predicted nucleic acid-binding protein
VNPKAGEFLDSSILVYAFTTDPRAAVAQVLLERGGIISVQGFNEFTSVARRKLGMTWEEVRDSLAAIRTWSVLFSRSISTRMQTGSQSRNATATIR